MDAKITKAGAWGAYLGIVGQVLIYVASIPTLTVQSVLYAVGAALLTGVGTHVAAVGPSVKNK